MLNALSNCGGLRGPGLLAFLVLLNLDTTGCLFRSSKPPRLFAPPTPVQKPVALKAPQELQAGPDLDIAAVPAPEIFSRPMPALPPPPRPPTPRNPPPAKAAAPIQQPPPDIPPPPKITQIFTADQRRELNRAVDESLDRVRKALETLGRKNLAGDQNDVVELIRTFQKQAEQAREQDLVTAVSLARRADLLAKDLLQRLP
jgi:hypothetical protein